MTHWKNLSRYADLSQASILDLGSGRGDFLIEAARQGGSATGLELNPAYIALSEEKARKAGVAIRVVQGRAEKLPFPDGTFDFMNVCEVIEHVDSPELMLREVCRALKPGGRAYMSVPNRFGMRDQHFHLYFVNWLPRAWADMFISLFGKHKDYGDASAGRQRLRDMHYYTYRRISALAQQSGLIASDARIQRISGEFYGPKRLIIRLLYYPARFFYFDSFHLLLTKPDA